MVYHHHDKFGGQRDCGSEELLYFIDYVSPGNHLFKLLYDILGGIPSSYVTTLLSLVASSIVVEEIKLFSIFQALQRLVTISIVGVEIRFSFVM